ncbi:MAG TPA: hypothetical protein V6C58_00105, partial [Allocoleopsis sp.]
MTLTITPEIKSFLTDLQSADLIGISLLDSSLGLRLYFTFGENNYDVAIELYHLYHLQISQPINTNNQDICYWVGEVEIKPFDTSMKNLLDYSKNQLNNSELNLSSLIYFHLSGDIDIQVLCQDYQFL